MRKLYPYLYSLFLSKFGKLTLKSPKFGLKNFESSIAYLTKVSKDFNCIGLIRFVNFGNQTNSLYSTVGSKAHTFLGQPVCDTIFGQINNEKSLYFDATFYKGITRLTESCRRMRLRLLRSC